MIMIAYILLVLFFGVIILLLSSVLSDYKDIQKQIIENDKERERIKKKYKIKGIDL